MIRICFKLIILLILMFFFFANGAGVITNGYVLSNMHIVFVLMFSIIISCKYDVLRTFIEKKRNNKYFWCMIFIILFFAIINLYFIFMPQRYDISNWFYTYYNSDFSSSEMLDFMFLPEFYDSINIFKMTLLESIFSSIFVYIAYLREKKETGKTAYILDRILKKIYRYNIFIVFLIFIVTVTNKFLFVKTVKYICFGIAFLMVLFEAVKLYLEINSCINKNEEKFGKENLIIIKSSEDLEFSLAAFIKNPLRIFYRFDNKSINKSLIVSGKKYTFVLYDVIKYKLLDINQYENIAYIMLININIIGNGYEAKEKLIKNIEEISSKTHKFLIYIKKSFLYKPIFLKDLQTKYSFKFRDKLNLKDVLDVVKIEPNADELKLKSKSLLEFINIKEIKRYVDKESKKRNLSKEEVQEEKQKIYEKIQIKPSDKREEKELEEIINKISEDRNTYLKYGLNQILDSFNYMEYFYTLLKMSEYVIHYMGLKSLLEEDIEEVKADNVKSGTWRELIDFNKEYPGNNNEEIEGIVSFSDISESIIRFNKIIKNSEKPNNLKNKFCFKDVCKTIGSIRNKMLVHGALSYKVAEENSIYLFNLLFLLVKEFEELNITIEDDEKIKNIFEKDISAVYRYSDRMFLYSNSIIEDKKVIYNECINYETGKKKVIDAKAEFDFSTRFSDEQIKEKLGKWMWYDNETKNIKS